MGKFYILIHGLTEPLVGSCRIEAEFESPQGSVA